MAKDPAFLFYPNDYLGGTIGMTFEEKGAYMELLMMQFNRGHMTSHMVGQVVGHLWDKIQDKFIQDDAGLWYNERLEIEQKKRQTFTASRKNNIKGKNQYTKEGAHMDGHVTSHMENENENRNENKSVVDKSKILESRKNDFAVELSAYSQKNGGQYPSEMLKAFFDYWTEKNKSGTQMRWQMEKTWETGKRLATWASREKPIKQLYANGTEKLGIPAARTAALEKW